LKFDGQACGLCEPVSKASGFARHVAFTPISVQREANHKPNEFLIVGELLKEGCLKAGVLARLTNRERACQDAFTITDRKSHAAATVVDCGHATTARDAAR
jgi:hypothetical protein